MSSSILVAMILCLVLLAALYQPLQFLIRFLFSAGIGAAVCYGASMLGVPVGINVCTILVSGFLGLPGAAGIVILGMMLS